VSWFDNKVLVKILSEQIGLNAGQFNATQCVYRLLIKTLTSLNRRMVLSLEGKVRWLVEGRPT